MVAGPNGSGKTTLIEEMRRQGIDLGEHINPDDIAQGLQGSYAARVAEAQRIADARREECIAARRSFSFETVMSHPSKIEVLNQAGEAGFFVQLMFIGTDDPRTNIERVALRVAQGGHPVPEDRIVNRWKRSMGFLAAAIRASDRAFIFDNSAAGIIDIGPRLILHGEWWFDARDPPTLHLERLGPVPQWVRDYVLRPFSSD